MIFKLANLIGIPVVGLHQGQRTYAPRRRAGNMTAATKPFSTKKVLAMRPSAYFSQALTPDTSDSPGSRIGNRRDAETTTEDHQTLDAKDRDAITCFRIVIIMILLSHLLYIWLCCSDIAYFLVFGCGA
jgi:hypothetical protein